MLTHTQKFEQEFKRMVVGRKGMTHLRFKLDDLLVPNYTNMVKPSEDKKLAIVKAIKEPYFEALNDVTVEVVGRMKLYKREILSDGSIRKDKNNEDVKNPVTIPQDSIALLSTVNIKLPNFVLDKFGERKKLQITKGFMYVDYIEKDGERKYIYIVPREHAYLLNLNALVLTPNKRRQYYKGYKLLMQDGNVIYLYVIPYSLRAYTAVRIIGTKPTYNFDSEITELLKLWVSNKILFNPKLTETDTGTNMTYAIEMPTLDTEDYIPYQHSLKEQKEIEFE